MKRRIGMALATLLLAVAPAFAGDAPKGCDMKGDHGCANAECCTKNADCCKDAKSCDMKDDHAGCKHAEGQEHACSKSCKKPS